MRLPHILMGSLIGLLLPSARAQGSLPAPPNIILILADDLGYGELGSYGQKLAPTPNLDRLATEGMRFTQFYAGSTVCAPSRSVLMTGQHLGHTRVRGNAAGGNPAAQTLAATDETVATVLQRAGYATGLVGKWGLGEADSSGAPWLQGFATFYGFLNQSHAHNHFPDFLWRDRARVDLPNDRVAVGSVPGVGYATRRLRYADDAFFDEAEAFISRPHGKPFFLELALTIPHANNERARVLGDGMEVPDYGSYANRNWPDNEKGHAAMNERMDGRVGRLLELLAKLGLEERTLVLFTSDNGPHREGGGDYDPEFIDSNGPLRGIKRDLTDGGIRVPLIARWPGHIPAGIISSQVGYFGDFMATWAELAHATVPAGTDSISLVPTLLGRGEQASHPYLYWEFYEGGPTQAVLIAGRWKAIRTSGAKPIVLYDLQNDVGETTDVAESHPDIVKHAEEIIRSAHVPNDFWRINPPVPKPASKTEILTGLNFGQLAAREVRVLLPSSAVTASTPVLIALDGQNMGSWKLEDALADLAVSGRRASPLVVAIASGDGRIEEYGMAGALDYAGRGKLAAEFQRFVISSVLPAVRNRYGVVADPAHTGIMGSSLGGLAAFDLAWGHPDVFGWAGIFSGSFWWRGEDGSVAVRQTSRLAHRLVRETPVRPLTQRYWFAVGTREEMDDRDGNGVIDAIQDTTELIDEMERRGYHRGNELTYLQVAGGEHNESTWAKALPGFLEWAFPTP